MNESRTVSSTKLEDHAGVAHVLALTPKIPLDAWKLEIVPIDGLSTALSAPAIERQLSLLLDPSNNESFNRFLKLLGDSPTGGSAGPSFKFKRDLVSGELTDIRLSTQLDSRSSPQDISGSKITSALKDLMESLTRARVPAAQCDLGTLQCPPITRPTA